MKKNGVTEHDDVREFAAKLVIMIQREMELRRRKQASYPSTARGVRVKINRPWRKKK